MMSVLEHQDILQVVELRAQQAEIKALQLENEVRHSNFADMCSSPCKADNFKNPINLPHILKSLDIEAEEH